MELRPPMMKFPRGGKNPHMLLGGLFVLVAVVGLNGFALFGKHSGKSSTHVTSEGGGVSELVSSATAKPPEFGLHVLFIGNSYVYRNDLPGMMVNIASSDPGNTTQLTVQSVTKGGANLQDTLREGIAERPMLKNKWDYVVLQEQSLWASLPGGVDNSAHAVKHFAFEIQRHGAKPVLFMTWQRKPGSHWYQDKEYDYLKGPDMMLDALNQHTHELGDSLGAMVADVGLYWHKSIGENGIDLYDPDGSHPNEAGTYLSALVFYKILTGHDVTKITWAPPSVSKENAQKLRSSAAGAL